MSKYTNHLLKREPEMLQKIQQSLATFRWMRYRELIAKRQAERLNPEEQTELIAMSDQIEGVNAKRIAYIAQLADIRKTTLPALMKDLGLKPISVSDR